jgi:hypothetical protein
MRLGAVVAYACGNEIESWGTNNVLFHAAAMLLFYIIVLQ